ncbi:hypothetical protein NV379_02440 [Paenibacillus sp. N1-5-1-14]|uniref:hypothetical protein n=1 Tax=Paenibacillus radicibacter TaxID=2972488 RepID=UPI002158DA24|nr:hypothetical protein [Paenibacillus radicibacter]MCR8641506.1 hypothetical protein [Paenibacillus radicibacter]
MQNSINFKKRFDIKQRLLENSGAFLTSENLGKLEAAFKPNGDFDRIVAEQVVKEILDIQSQMFQ